MAGIYECEEQAENLRARRKTCSNCPGELARLDKYGCEYEDDEDCSSDSSTSESFENHCPGTLDILSGKMVPCREAWTLREIALGRKLRRIVPKTPEVSFDAVESSDDRQQRHLRAETRGGKKCSPDNPCPRGSCICKKKGKSTADPPGTFSISAAELSNYFSRAETKIPKPGGRCVTFDR